ncbi:MAG TPA: Gfo/Idh/MocA family oxidoreductase [Bryobacteraceae bacterium]|nr:Gfo/Idh/MocA family oxidoreductase [Bryobacteraceae bacterium]
MTQDMDRRSFLKAGAAAAAMVQSGRVMGANDRVRIAVIGLRGRGFDHIKRYQTIPGVEIAAVCDVDENVMAMRLADIDKLGLAKPKTFIDYREVLGDKSIDAVSITTPNHWHALMGIWACQAEKDAYVEKPCSHSWWEGKQLVAAAAKYNRIVQHGTQSRSSLGAKEAIQHLRDGLLGDVYLARGLCYKWRDTIGRKPKEPVPAGVHYDLWLGPAPDRGFTLNRFHYNWHWFWDTGNGDIGNQGIHELDTARWGLGVGFPTKVSAMGGHMMFDDDQETPNVLTCSYSFRTPDGKHRLMEFEVRHWMTNHEAEIGTWGRSTLPPAGLDAGPTKSGDSAKKSSGLGPATGKPGTIGNIYYGPKGYLAIQEYESYKSWLGDKNEPGPEGRGKENHFENFIDCVRSRKKEDLGAPVEEGHISCTLIHLANVSYRLGRTLNFDPVKEEVIGDAEANRLLREEDRGYRKGFTIPQKV